MSQNKKPIPIWVLLLVVALVAAIAYGLKLQGDISSENQEDDITEQLGG